MPVLLVLTVILCLASAETNGTESYFLSPRGLGRTPEVGDALSKIFGQIRVKRTTYSHSTITYVLDNVVIGTAYNDAKQAVTIPKSDIVRVSGGRVEFTYRFNYTKIENRNNVTGYAYGTSSPMQAQSYRTPSPTTSSWTFAAVAGTSAGGWQGGRGKNMRT
jgi:hypothetical protein